MAKQQRMYSIKDVKSVTYHNPFPAENTIIAMRETQSFVNNQKSQIADYPEDFQLWYVGTFDNDTGRYLQEEPAFVIEIVSLKKENQNAK